MHHRFIPIAFSHSSLLKAAQLFNVNVIIVLDHERMYADLKRDLPKTVKIVHAPKSGGAESLSILQESDCRRDIIHRVNSIMSACF